MLETRRLVLRRPKASDLPFWQAYFASERARLVGGGPAPNRGFSRWVFATFVGRWELNGCGPFVVLFKERDYSFGLVGPWYPSNWPEKELTWPIWAPDYEGHSIALEAASAVRSHVFDELGWRTAVSYIAPRNTRSIALAERLGRQRDIEAQTPDDDDVLVYRHRSEQDQEGILWS